jgi:hypothetical protein
MHWPSGSSISIYNVQVATNATNASLSWDEDPGTGPTTLYWGLTTSYPYTPIVVSVNETYSNGSARFAVQLLDFLEPSTTYHFEIYVQVPPGFCGGGPWLHTGSWTTGGDSSLYIKGNIYGIYSANGTRDQPAPANTTVELTCARPVSGDGEYSRYALTNRSGYYSIPLWQIGGNGFNFTHCNSYGSNYSGYNVSVLNGVWPGYFNETVFVWSAQAVDFYLPHNFLSPYFTEVLDFSNDAIANESTISYSDQATTTVTTELTHSWSLGGSAGGGSGTFSGSTTAQSSASFSGGLGFAMNGGTLDWIVRQNETGWVAFSAFTREWAQTCVSFTSQPIRGQPAQNDSGFTQPADWMIPANVNNSNFSATPIYYLNDPDIGLKMHNQVASAIGFYYKGAETVSTSVGVTSTYSVEFSLSAQLEGVGSANLGVGMTWSQTGSTTSSHTLDWSIGRALGEPAFCVDVFGEGGSGDHADMIGIYTWALVGGVCQDGK